MAFRMAHWSEIQTCKRAFMTLPDGERVFYRVLGFRDLQTVNGLKPYAKIRREDDTSDASGLYPVNALVFETASGELVK
jgi:hypothetical protein